MWGPLVYQCQYVYGVTVTAYKHFKGQVLGSKDLDDLFNQLRSNGLLKYSYILTGTSCSYVCVKYLAVIQPVL